LDVLDEGGVQAGGGAGDSEDGGGYGLGEQRDDDGAVDADRCLVDVAERGVEAEPGEGVADLRAVGPQERHGASGGVADGGSTGDGDLVVAGQERLGAAALQQGEEVGGVVEFGQLAADGATGEFLGVQVEVETGGVGPDGI